MDENNFDLMNIVLEGTENYSQEENINEAYFVGGAEKMKPIEDAFQAIIDKYNELKNQAAKDNKGKLIKINDKNRESLLRNFTKLDVFKQLEKSIIETFGVRSVNVYPIYIVSGKNKKEYLNAYTYTNSKTRFYIDGLITKDGFYDSTHTLNTTVCFSATCCEIMTAKEMVALFLHEFGHNIDPKLVSIKYTGDQLLIDSILKKKRETNSSNNKSFVKAIGDKLTDLTVVMKSFSKKKPKKSNTDDKSVKLKWHGLSKDEKKLRRFQRAIERTDLMLKIDEDVEAFADNFPRMYGYGQHLLSALNKIDEHDADDKKYLFRKVAKAHDDIINGMMSQISDTHGTYMQRARSLINECELDLKDPNIPDEVKKAVQSDLEEIKKIYNEYSKSPNTFKNDVIKVVIDKLEREYGSDITQPVVDNLEKSPKQSSKPSTEEDDKKDTVKDEANTESKK